MSNRAMTWAWGQKDLPLSGKLVLLRLADMANDASLQCFPAVATIVADTGLSERAVRLALADLKIRRLISSSKRWLESDGSRRETSSVYTMNLVAQPVAENEATTAVEDATAAPMGASSAPMGAAKRTRWVQQVHPGGESAAPESEGESEVESVSLRERAYAESKTARQHADQGSRLPAGWRPSQPDIEVAQSLGLNAETVLATFTDYWLAQPGAKGRKADWAATWRNWCRRQVNYPAGNGRSGRSERSVGAGGGIGRSAVIEVMAPDLAARGHDIDLPRSSGLSMHHSRRHEGEIVS